MADLRARISTILFAAALFASLSAGCSFDSASTVPQSDNVRETTTAVPDPTSPAVTSLAANTTPAPATNQLLQPVALTDMTGFDRYKGEDGGLYGNGLNVPPPAHRESALNELSKIQPLDKSGNPAPDGKIGFISIGMSNTTQEFSVFKQLADVDPAKSRFVNIVDGAQGGQTGKIWASQEQPWQVLAQRLDKANLSPAQVQVAWIKQADAQPSRPFPAEARQLESELAFIVQHARLTYPNLRLVFLSSRTYGGYATTALNPEPYAFESGFSVRWLIQRQIDGDPELNFKAGGNPVKAPLLLWGPYLWADGSTPRGDGFTWEKADVSASDGTHPSETGRMKVARALLDFFKTNEFGLTWFTAK